jgi:two-component system LytT family response regulator
MRMMRVVVVEDQAPAREHLVSLLETHTDIEIVAVCADGEAAVRAIAESRADVVLLDIQLPECSGFDVIRRVGAPRMPAVIFITAHESHAVRAFEVRALDYIVKPFSLSRVNRALDLVRVSTRQRRIAAAAADLATLMTTPSPAPRLPLRRRDGTVFVAPEEVEYVRANRNEVVLYTGDAEHRVRATLDAIRVRLGDSFVQVHRSMLVNFDRIRPVLLVGAGGPRLRLTSGREVRVSEAFRSGVEARLRARG